MRGYKTKRTNDVNFEHGGTEVANRPIFLSSPIRFRRPSTSLISIGHAGLSPTNSSRIQHLPDHAILPGFISISNSTHRLLISKFKLKSNFVCIDLDTQPLNELIVSYCSPLHSGHFHLLESSQYSLNLCINIRKFPLKNLNYH